MGCQERTRMLCSDEVPEEVNNGGVVCHAAPCGYMH